ncbi:MAG: helix-hairpin-helix domain-containing protein [Eubacterium sp.]|jgi:competence protein ComEA|nr:helix-hairpin-helix domain-containing protein [Eubacterium sp.]MCH4046033.1 helix-hairpin-helix domain-containing protein [Eubacterium sp.]MCH4079128.1 helix-hairpin-helix domain-containing protein [Eubacterium sp.]MCH4110746.1 helix-hairpin-helix domain-containing protein [Eubacterium sp.]MCI1306888.1 helix-hairpin-helix domain-containing protein [Eubacterium sp.]
MEQKLRQLKRWKDQHHKMLIITAAIIFMVAAFAFYVLNGKSGTIPESKAGESTVQEISLEGDGSGMQEDAPSKVFVDIAGAVKKPGVYEVDASARMFEVVDEAGGLTKEADTSLMNLAERVSDGMKIVIPSKGTAVSNAADEYSVPGQSGNGGAADGNSAQGGAGANSAGASGSQNSNLVNINQADLLQLQKINGVGPVTAEAIKAYREEHGLFQKKEDLKKVRGIGDKTFEKIKDQITL